MSNTFEQEQRMFVEKSGVSALKLSKWRMTEMASYGILLPGLWRQLAAERQYEAEYVPDDFDHWHGFLVKQTPAQQKHISLEFGKQKVNSLCICKRCLKKYHIISDSRLEWSSP